MNYFKILLDINRFKKIVDLTMLAKGRNYPEKFLPKENKIQLKKEGKKIKKNRIKQDRKIRDINKIDQLVARPR